MRVLKYPQDTKLLRVAARSITQDYLATDEFATNLKQMENLLKLDGMGLAATQVGWPVQLFMLCQDANLENCPIQVFINPKIINYSKNTVKDSEGCLSFPGLFVSLPRAEHVTWTHYDLSWNLTTVKSTQYYARAVQHEIDHLNGKLMIDYLSSAQQIQFKRWLNSET